MNVNMSLSLSLSTYIYIYIYTHHHINNLHFKTSETNVMIYMFQVRCRPCS